jgi:tRNA uridine 5-carboxymethylaminomethyl modification enzyme
LDKRKVAAADTAALPALDKHMGRSFAHVLKDPAFTLDMLAALEASLQICDERLRTHAELDIKYEGYLRRQQKQVERFKRMEKLSIPGNVDYDVMRGLSKESREKLKAIRPLSVGQASRIAGVRNSDVAVLLVYLTKKGGA